MKQLSADVVIINEKAASYVQELQGSLEALVRGSQLRLSPDTSAASGKIFLLRGDLVSPQTRAQLQSVARVYAPQPPRHSRRTDFEIAAFANLPFSRHLGPRAPQNIRR